MMQLGDAVDSFIGAAGIASAVLVDPALPEVIARIQELQAFETSPEGSAYGIGGIGLANTLPFIDAYIFYRKHPYGTAAIGLSVLAIPALIGYLLAK